MGGQGQKPQNGRTKFLNLLILEHLKIVSLKPQINFWCALKLMGLPAPLIYLCYSNSSKNIFIVKTPWNHIIFILMFWNVFFKETIYSEFEVAD